MASSRSITQKELYKNIIFSENTATEFLREQNLLPPKDEVVICLNKKGVICGSVMKQEMKKNFPILLCTNRKCSTTRSIRKSSHFFSNKDKNRNTGHDIKIHEILELMWLWVNLYGLTMTRQLTNKSPNCIRHWFNRFRDVCSKLFEQRGKLGGKGTTVQIDETLFQGKIKYNRGRLQTGDKTLSRKRSKTMPTLCPIDETDNSNDESGLSSCPLEQKLSEEWWRSMHTNKNELFFDFLDAIKEVYPIA